MDTDKSSFDWLRKECEIIRSQGFHRFKTLTLDDLYYKREELAIPVVGDYGRFLREFGDASMFNGWGNLIEIPFLIYPLKEFRREVLKNGRSFVAFGDRGNQHVFFDEASIVSGKPSPVFLLSGRDAREIYQNFSDWLYASYVWARSKYSPRQWALVINGAKPFSIDELKIVEARRLFEWRLVGFAENGDAIFEVENHSNLVLPFLSIGVKDSDDSILIGGVWLDVSEIKPGEKKRITKDCYKDRISNDKLVVFAKPDPAPEERDRYWEFGG